MNKNLMPNRPGKNTPTSVTNIRGNISRQTGNIRSATLENRAIITNQIPLTYDAIRESIEEAFGE